MTKHIKKTVKNWQNLSKNLIKTTETWRKSIIKKNYVKIDLKYEENWVKSLIGEQNATKMSKKVRKLSKITKKCWENK